MKQRVLFVCALILCLAVLVGPAMALVCKSDDAANDFPGQKDLTQLCVGEVNNGYLSVTWNWDEISSSGNNGIDACSLYDTNGNGNVDYAVCVQWKGERVIQEPLTVYSCPADNLPYNCAGATVLSTYSSSCTVGMTSNAPFDTYDTIASCGVYLSDFGGSGVLVDVCAYPSGSPNSAASDCIMTSACSSGETCDDGISCTEDLCDTSQGAGFCRHTPIQSECSNNDVCDGGEICDPITGDSSTGCTNPENLDCDDSNACTDDSCDAVTGCSNPNKGSGTLCGSAGDGICELQDTCDGAEPALTTMHR